MIVRLAGHLLEKHPDHVVIDVQGIGYHVWITLNTYKVLPETGQDVILLIHHQVREDSQELFGFADNKEREAFVHLIAINGIGAKTAIIILSGASPDELARNIQEGNEEFLVSIRSIGAKTALRILLEMKDKLLPGESANDGTSTENAATQAAQSLVSLGYAPREAQRAVRAALKIIDSQAPVEDIIRAALSGK